MSNVDRQAQTFRDKAANLRDAASAAGQDAADTARDAVDRVAGDVKSAAHDLRRSAERSVDALKDSGGEVYDAAQGFAGALSKGIQTSVRQQPFTAIGMALAAGFVIGSMMRR